MALSVAMTLWGLRASGAPMIVFNFCRMGGRYLPTNAGACCTIMPTPYRDCRTNQATKQPNNQATNQPTNERSRCAHPPKREHKGQRRHTQSRPLTTSEGRAQKCTQEQVNDDNGKECEVASVVYAVV